MKRPDYETRDLPALRKHYSIEKELASRLRAAPRSERRVLYRTLYDELFRRVPDHPQLRFEGDDGWKARTVQQKWRLVSRWLRPTTRFLEIGAGDCRFATLAASHVKTVYALDVSDEITKKQTLPPNVSLILSDGVHVPLPDASIDVAYSNQLMEHLHPDDATDQLRDIYRVLAPGGSYICITPNRLAGPHDVSQYFDDTATGFHLREYTMTELVRLFRATGFAQLQGYIGGKGVYLRWPLLGIFITEWLLSWCPTKLRRFLANLLPIRAILGVILVGVRRE